MNGYADSDACLDRVFVKRFAALGHIGNSLAEAITARATGFFQNNGAAGCKLGDCSAAFRGRGC